MVEGEGDGRERGLQRRAVLLSMGAGFGTALSGCSILGNSSRTTPTGTEPPTDTPPVSTPTESETPTESQTATESSVVSTPRVSNVETSYLNPFVRQIWATKLAVDDPVAFEDLSEGYQLAVANAITRTEYQSDPRPEGPEGVRYRGSTFEIRSSVADPAEQPKTPGGPEWRTPLSLSAAVEDESFVVSVTNELDDPFPVHHYARPSPYFSVLTAVSDNPKLLPHDGYDHMEALRTKNVVRVPSDEFWARKIRRPGESTDTRSPTATEDLPSFETVLDQLEKSQVTHLDPGQSLRESYGLPSDLPPESTVWLSLPIGDDSTELTDGTTWTFTATITLET